MNANDFTLLASNFGQSGFGDDEGDSFARGGPGDEYYTYEELWEMLMAIVNG